MVEVGIDTVVTDHRVASPVKTPANCVDLDVLFDVIKRETGVPQDGRRKTKPHFNIGYLLHDWDKQLVKRDYEAKVQEARDRLSPVMEVLKDCY